MSRVTSPLHISFLLLVMGYLLLLSSLFAQTYAEPPENALWWHGLLLWLFKVMPLLLMVRGLFEGRHTTSSWLSYLSLLYFIFGVLLIFTPGGTLFGYLVTFASLLIFWSSLFYTRWKKAALLSLSPSK